MPDSVGKRQRRDVKARKAAAREELRLARNRRRQDRAAGVIREQPSDAPPPDGAEHAAAVDPQPDGPEPVREGETESDEGV
jgi:hypothetical protein